MDKTILIPTDFSVKSVQLVKVALEKNKNQTLKIILVHGTQLSSSITDLLFYSKSKIIEDLKTDDFNASCQVLKSRYGSQLHSLSIELFTGFLQSSFNAFLEVSGVDEIYYYENHPIEMRSSKSIDLRPLIMKSPVQKIGLTVLEKEIKEAKEPLSDLIFSRQAT